MEDYCDVLGQMVIFNKSAMTSGKGACKKSCKSIAAILGVRFLIDNEKYLGDPLIIGKNNCKTFEPLINRVKSKVKSWQAPLLSQAGRNTLIKSVASTLPVYTISILRLPKKIAYDLDDTYRKFWCSDPKNKKNFHIIKWKETCKSIYSEGLGIRSSDCNIRALLAKIELLCTRNQP